MSEPRGGFPRSAFAVDRVIRFSDCDPAGIVFYPQYFVMLNGLLEDWIDGPLGIGFQDLIARRRIGLPTVHLEADFKSVSRFGDRVKLSLDVAHLGTRSITLALACACAETGELRIKVRQVVVTTSLATHEAIVIPPDLRAAIEESAPLILDKEPT
jgi:4-hydroxybenzoyl-CoA thioesterase